MSKPQMQVTVRSLLAREDYQKRFGEILGARAGQFSASVSNIARDRNIAECDPQSVIAAAIVAASLDLPVDRNLGFAWIIPYKESGNAVAQFQMGYKGFIQLALRTGQYARMNSRVINAEAFGGYDDVGEPRIIWENIDETKPAIGYAFAWKLTSGFVKTCFWSKAKVEDHARRYSMAFKKGFNSPWKTHFDQMALKTVIKNELSDWGIMTVELHKAVRHDQGAQSTMDADVVYPDNSTARIADTTDIPAELPPPPAQISQPTPQPDPRSAQKDDGDLAPATPATCRYCNAPVTDMANHECEGMRAAIGKAEAATAEQKVAAAPGSDNDALESVALLAKQAKVSEEAILDFARRNKLAKPEQKELSQLATSKLQSLIKTWPNIVVEIQRIQAELSAPKPS